MKFHTVVNCMDGRVQLPVIEYLKERFKVDYVDSVTEPGPVKILSDGNDERALESIFSRIGISLERHNSTGIAVVAHHDCVGNPVPDEVQARQLRESAALLKNRFQTDVTALWVDGNRRVREVRL
ncbi:MAG: hypothetical protein GXP32_09590 [Kiritimatiellaeota bacterium]|nr:hypothetical protein [Kiritimatiellota bacterium]